MPTGIFVRTEEHKHRISESLKGRPHPWSEKSKVEIHCPCGVTKITTKGCIIGKRGKYCSRKCYYKYRICVSGTPKGSTRPPFSMEWRRKISETRKRRGVAKGSNNPRWRGGITLLQVKIRNSDQYKIWRSSVYGRDGYVCVGCGEIGNGSNLEADHVFPLSMIVSKYNLKTFDQALKTEDLWDITNGRTLCIECHKKTDTYGWRVWNNYLKPLERRERI